MLAIDGLLELWRRAALEERRQRSCLAHFFVPNGGEVGLYLAVA